MVYVYTKLDVDLFVAATLRPCAHSASAMASTDWIPRMYKCAKCEKTFGTLWNKNRHEATCHGTSCERCGRKCQSTYTLKRHQLKCGVDYIRSKCNKSFNTSYLLSRHERSCRAEVPSRTDIVSEALVTSGVVLINDTPTTTEYLSQDTNWASHPTWLAYATRLDHSQVMFYLPDLYEAIVALTGVDFGYYEARTRSGDITLYIIGVFVGVQPIGPFWDKNFSLSNVGETGCAVRLLKFGKSAQDELEVYEKEWESSCSESEKYLSIHRACVRRVGQVLGVDMEDHDITKSRIVQVALGYMWHWTGNKSMRTESLMQLAQDAIKAGHLELENHHPEFHGQIDYEKLFADRVAVHLQKDSPDGGNGWLLDPRFIPGQYREQWEAFRQKHRHLDMYTLVWDYIHRTRA